MILRILAGILLVYGTTVLACGNSSSGSGALCGPNGTNQCGPTRQCDPTLGCVECSMDTDCSASAKFCIRGSCEACRDNFDCGVAAPACFPERVPNVSPTLTVRRANPLAIRLGKFASSAQ
jgi:hypothetical protein